MRISLSTKLAVAMFCLAAFGNGVTAYLIYNNTSQALQTSISSNQAHEAAQTMDKIDRFLYERLVDLQSLSGRQQIQDFLSQPALRTPEAAAALSKQLSNFKVSTGIWSELTIVDTQGIQPLPSSLQNLANELVKQPSVLKLFTDAQGGKTVYSDALLLPQSKAPVMLFMSPVRDERATGQPVVGVLAGELAWQANLDILRSLSGSTATLINNKGLSLGENGSAAGSEILAEDFSKTTVFKLAQKNDSGSGVLPGLDEPKQRFLTSYTKEPGFLDYRGNTWRLVLETPQSVAFAPAHKLDKILVITFSGFFILSLIALLAVLRYLILKPLSNLREITGRLTIGDFSLRSTIRTKDELGSLGNDFNNMADKIQLAYKDLRQTNTAAQKDKRTMQTVLENLPVGVLVVEAPSGRPLMMNRVAEKISGRSGVQVNNLTSYTQVYDVVKEDGSDYPEAERPLAIALSTGLSSLKEDTYIKKPNNEIIAVRILASPIQLPDGSIQSVVSVFEDVSEARSLERSRDEFFSIASHELRTPLTAIRGNTSLIQQYFKPALNDPELKSMVEDIHESSIRLIDIVNDFLDTSRLEQKRVKYEFADTNMVEVAVSGIKEYLVTGSRRKIHIEVIKPAAALPNVWADKNRAKQILINLVGNALKFTEEGSITISFIADGKNVKTLVTDTGQGMDKEAQQKLFRKFEQTGSKVLTRDSIKGTGLGLYISKMIVEQMRGSIKLEQSTPGKGTTFSFSLPSVSEEAKRQASNEGI